MAPVAVPFLGRMDAPARPVQREPRPWPAGKRAAGRKEQASTGAGSLLGERISWSKGGCGRAGSLNRR
jgi:hypothetical protein